MPLHPPSLFRHPSEPEVPFLDRHYPASSVLRTSPPPCRPGLTLAGFRLVCAAPPTGLPVLLPSPSSMRAIVSTPAEPDGAWVARFPSGGNLPRINGGSASALLVSRPAQRLLRVMARMVAEPPKAVLLSECFSPYRCLYGPLRLLPAGATVAGRDSHPQGNGAFPRRTIKNPLSG